MKTISKLFITGYQETLSLALRLLFGKGCRFTPSCSEYTKEAIVKHGVVSGTLLGLRRLSKCHPWGGQGYDPVPKKI